MTTELDTLRKQLAESEATIAALREALKLLHDETREYVEINSLGDPYHNRSMQLARQALAATEPQAEKDTQP